ncbi:MAG: hypothetical protein LBD37_03195 [Treponema sp.]|jgi:hypothetical protein|nr:hypothetical protein [Treponema sp.]
MPVLFVLLGTAGLLFPACAKEGLPAVVREDRFTLDIGRMEDEIDLFNLEHTRRKTALAMRNGLFYIANGNGEKVVRYTSYGDILFMIYNEETNPPPLTLRTGPGDAKSLAARWAVSHPLLEPGAIAVDSRNHSYVEDRFLDERYAFDPENNALLSSVVLHFNQDGRFAGRLGQEGVGGTPFPHITGLYTSQEDELAVVCRHTTGWHIYWFDAAGILLYSIPLQNSGIPLLPGRPGVFPLVDAVMAAPDSRRLFIKADYYRDTFDESANTRSGGEPEGSAIWIMNAENGAYDGSLALPFFEYPRDEHNQKFTGQFLYSMMGVMRNNQVFLSFPIEGGYSLLIINADSQERRRAFIRVDREELHYTTFHISQEGIISGILATNWQARIVWWRADRLAEELSS